VRQWLRW